MRSGFDSPAAHAFINIHAQARGQCLLKIDRKVGLLFSHNRLKLDVEKRERSRRLAGIEQCGSGDYLSGRLSCISQTETALRASLLGPGWWCPGIFVVVVVMCEVAGICLNAVCASGSFCFCLIVVSLRSSCAPLV